MQRRLMLLFSAMILAISVIGPKAHADDASDGDLLFGWSYPFNNSTYRVYSAYLARIKTITEIGNDYVEFDNEMLGLNEVTLYGDVDSGDVLIERLHLVCWRVTMVSDYLLLRRSWKADPVFDGVCYEYYYPFVSVNNGAEDISSH